MNSPIKEARKMDIPMIASIEKYCFDKPWSEQAIIDTFFQPDTFLYIWGDIRRISAYIIGRKTADEGEILRFGVLPYMRHIGIGGKLLRALQVRFQQENVKYMFLEVRQSNKQAIRLYQKNHFIVTGRRPKYYEDPMEDAIIMVWDANAQTLPVEKATESLYNDSHKEDSMMRCNICGERLKEKQDYLEIKKEWGYFSKKDLEVHSLRICESCYDDLCKRMRIPVTKTEKTEV